MVQLSCDSKSPASRQKILVTGGSGLVGKAIEAVSSEYSDCEFIFHSSKDFNLLDYDATYHGFQSHLPCDGIIHLAANVGGLFKNLHHNTRMFEENCAINMNVLRAAHANGIQRVVSILSTCIFPDKVEYPIREEYLHLGAPHDSNCGYAYAKRMLEVQSKLYQRDYGRDYICVIPTNIYGAHDNFHVEDAHVIPALIHKCFLQKMKNEPFVVMGSGRPLRQFIYSTDLAKLILWTFLEYRDHESLILSVPEEDEVSIENVARIIARKMNYEEQLVFDTSKSDGQYKKSVSNQKLKTLLPTFTFTPIERGLETTIDWFLKHYPHIRK